jgi:hypothetical protein
MNASLPISLFSLLTILALVDSVEGAVIVAENSGSATARVFIQVPKFRGLEPDVALVYHSSGGNGIVGVGWSLSGFPTIERRGAKGGSPQYDSSDAFLLGGEEVLPCGTSSSPGCLAGGTHFTRHESYARISFDSGVNEWTVDSRSGTRSVYVPLFVGGLGTFRWGLKTVTDVLGNVVDYNWWCDPGRDCFPDGVTYNGYRVKLYYASTRPDTITYATGMILAENHQRLRSITVELASGSAIRAYKLTYSTSNSTRRSLLSSVRMYGKDVDLDGSGNIMGGTSLPAETITYVTDASDPLRLPTAARFNALWIHLERCHLQVEHELHVVRELGGCFRPEGARPLRRNPSHPDFGDSLIDGSRSAA